MPQAIVNDNVFKLVHEKIGRTLMQEMNDRKLKTANADKPLIIF